MYDKIWGQIKVSKYQLKAGDRAALFNIGITQTGWRNSIIGGTVFLHPRSCKMSILKAIKAICIRACLIQDEFDACEVNTWTPLIVSTAQSVVPCLKESMIAEEYRILYGETRDFPTKEDIIKKYNVIDIDKDNCFVFDEVRRYGA